ncbi:hypothetical protein TNCV_638511 [Trichonephila clavipes]|nr:hypothetical protein TNCV_638511 [Trichonephila clavipes]
MIAVLSKLSVDDPEKCTKMKSCQDIEIVELLNDEITDQFQQQRDALRQDAKKQIYKVQDENRRTYNLRRR